MLGLLLCPKILYRGAGIMLHGIGSSITFHNLGVIFAPNYLGCFHLSIPLAVCFFAVLCQPASREASLRLPCKMVLYPFFTLTNSPHLCALHLCLTKLSDSLFCHNPQRYSSGTSKSLPASRLIFFPQKNYLTKIVANLL
jgi:hypothetical protein